MGYFNDFMDSDGSEFGFNYIPDYIDPMTGNYKTGARKCSNCKSFKTKADFTKEEAKKAATRRICNECIASGAAVKKTKARPAARATPAATPSAAPPLPDINSMKIKEMKQELESYGTSTASILEKSDLVTALVDARKVRLATTALTLECIQSLKVTDLKQELKARGCPVSGLKAVLQRRLADAVGVSMDSAEVKSSTKKMPVDKVEEKTIHVLAPIVEVNMIKNANFTHPTKLDVTEQQSNSKLSNGVKIAEKKTDIPVRHIVNAAPPQKELDVTEQQNNQSTKEKKAVSVAPSESANMVNKENNVPRTNLNVADQSTHDGNKKVQNDDVVLSHKPTRKIKQWRMVPPPTDAAQITQNAQGCTFYWCDKCKYWATTHGTAGHIDKKKTVKVNRQKKKNSKQNLNQSAPPSSRCRYV